MLIAFTHNLQLSDREEEAEFDRPETVHAIAKALQRFGHAVELIEVSGPASRVVARLEALNPHLVFNTAEGKTGRYREAFYPGLFDQLGLAYTGSDAYVCTLTLDKGLAKMKLAARGIPTPRWLFLTDLGQLSPLDLRFPLIIKPNFEGSSKGITQDSIVEDEAGLRKVAGELLTQYPEGLLVEEYIEGKDVTVPFLETVSPRTNGVLEPAEYIFNSDLTGNRRYDIYDYDLKNLHDRAVSVKIPASLSEPQKNRLQELSAQVVKVLGIRDFGRIDYRITPEGSIYFIEVNALPSLEPGASIYQAARRAGLASDEEVPYSIVRSAARRFGIEMKRAVRRTGQYRVGLTYNLKRVVPTHYGSDDSEAEYDSPKTIQAIREAIESYGHEVVELEATPELPAIASSSQLDLVFNIAEGIRGRSRESQIPALLELLDIPYTGSDPATLSIALDKALAKRVVRQSGVPTPDFMLMRTGNERIPREFGFPVIVKPNTEGSSKGVDPANVAETEEELRRRAQAMIAKYSQPVLVEAFLSGREFTLGLLGEHRPRVLPPMEIVFKNHNQGPAVYSFEHKLNSSDEIHYEIPAKVEPALLRELQRVARESFVALNCRDVARIDLRLDEGGRPNFLECNPLPGLTPGWSDLCLISEKAGMDYRTLIGEILSFAIGRLKQMRREKPGTTAP
jgi:D-alanine-D-alanine ligase